MVLRGRHRRRQVSKAEFLQAGQEAFLLLATKHPEHEFAGIRRPAPRHHREDESGEVGMIQFGDASPSQPLHLLRALLLCGHFRSPCSADLAGCEHTRPRRHAKFAASVLIPKFVSLHGILVYELRNQKDTGKSMILVWLLVQKSA
jgi:hypothetical protein